MNNKCIKCKIQSGCSANPDMCDGPFIDSKENIDEYGKSKNSSDGINRESY